MVGGLQGLAEVTGAGHVGEVHAHRAGQVGDPAQGIAAAIGMGVQDRPPRGFPHRKQHIGLAGHGDAFLVHGHRRIRWFAAEIGRVDVAVGEAPGYVPVAADDDRRHARQREAADIDLATRCLRIRIAQAHAEPQAGRTQGQVHVVGDDGAAIGGQRTGHGEVVAADRIGVGGRRGGRGSQRAQVQLGGVGQHRVAARFALQGRVPAAAIVGQQRMQGRRHHVADARQRQFVLVARVLQVGVHGQPGQHAVAGLPGCGRLPQQQVGPGPHRQIGQARVDPVDVGTHGLRVVAKCVVQVRFGARAQPVHAHALVGVDGHRPEQRRQFARGTAAHQVHLEITFLRMHMAEGTHGIGLAAGGDGDHPQRVALDADRRGQPGQGLFALQFSQAAAQQQPQDQCGDQHDGDEHSQYPTPGTSHCRSFRHSWGDCSRRRNCD